MQPKEINQATEALVKAVQADAVRSGQNVETRMAGIEPNLATGSNVPGGYMYERNVGTTIPALTAKLVAQGKQDVLKAVIRDNLFNANKKLEDAKYGLRERQRAYQREQAKRNRAARARASSMSFGAGGVSYGPTGGNTISGININQNAQKAPSGGVTPGTNGVFWRGADGKVYVKGGQGTNAAGKWDANTQKYWQSRGFTMINDPVRRVQAPKKINYPGLGGLNDRPW